MKMIILLNLMLGLMALGGETTGEVTADGVSAKDYYENQGSPHAKFEFDGDKPGYFFGDKTLSRTFLNKEVIPGTDKKIGKENIKLGIVLSKKRAYLLENNLFDTGVDNASGTDCTKIMGRVHRSAQGRCYFHNYPGKLAEQDKDLASQVMMGSVKQRFGRNTTREDSNKAIDQNKSMLMTPNPLEISQRIFNRKDGKTKEATVINVLATAWLQAMNHDWFSHGKNSKKRHHKVPAHASHPHFKEGMKIPHTVSETSAEKSPHASGYDYNSRNHVTHWWDASQIYGSSQETINKVRGKYVDGKRVGLLAEGKIAVDSVKKKLIYTSDNKPVTGFHDNWWTGLELIHTVFHLEHNAIIDNVLKPQIGRTICLDSKDKAINADCSEELFEKARMINAALIAKIHTAEWTPALLDNASLNIGMRANWYGALRDMKFNPEKSIVRGLLPEAARHLVSGLTGEKTLDLYSKPFTLTEEFVAVYRMHPLIPEAVKLRSAVDSKSMGEIKVKDLIFRKAQGVINRTSSNDLMYSFGTSHPGAMTLHNYPTFMQNFIAERNTGKRHSDAVRMDMGAVDVLRDRERGVPRYNAFRKAIHLPEIKSFNELLGVPADKADANYDRLEKDARLLEEIYGDINKVDLLVGTLAENDRYPGYAFGNTPFYIFALMASRRLMADPFFSDYYTAEYYTRSGLKHVQNQTMVDVILRHYPSLKSKFYKKDDKGKDKQVVKNAFRPWRPVYEKVKASL